jgi:DNA-binding HxlR family transcriptional regulator
MEKLLLQKELLQKCPVQHSLKFIGGKWRIGIIWSMKLTCRRFGELKRDVLGITEKMLIQELRYLESIGIVDRHAYYEIPPKVEYSLTDRGRTLIPIIESIVSWGYADLEENQGFRKEDILTE